MGMCSDYNRSRSVKSQKAVYPTGSRVCLARAIEACMALR